MLGVERGRLVQLVWRLFKLHLGWPELAMCRLLAAMLP